MEDPAFRRAAGELAGLRILDLGCGDGTFGAACAEAGCASYLGVDGSEQMIDRATASVTNPVVRFECQDIEDYEAPPRSFDLIVSRMALHYVCDLGPVLQMARQGADAGGRPIFTVVHPVITAANREPDGPRRSQVVEGYFQSGERQRQWFGKPVIWQHRTVEQYLNAVSAAGFNLDAFSECEPDLTRFDGDLDEYERRRQVPVFLLIGATAV